MVLGELERSVKERLDAMEDAVMKDDVVEACRYQMALKFYQDDSTARLYDEQN